MMHPRNRARIRACAVAGLAVAASIATACGGDATGPKTPIGAYALATVNGKALPARLFNDSGFTVDIADGSLALQDGGRFVYGVTAKWTVDGAATMYVTSDTGTWTQTGNRITLLYVDSTTQAITWDGSRVTLTDSGFADVTTYVFNRR